MEHGIIQDFQISASSYKAANDKNWGRLNSVGWCVDSDRLQSAYPGKVRDYYLQIDFLEPHLIYGVATQGKQPQNPDDPNERPEAVTSFYLKYSFMGNEWFRYHTVWILYFWCL